MSCLMLPEMLIASEGRRRQVLFWAQPCNDRHCGAASAPRPGLAGSSAIEGTAVMRRVGRVRLFYDPTLPSPPSARDSSYRGISCRPHQGAGNAIGAQDPRGYDASCSTFNCYRHVARMLPKAACFQRAERLVSARGFSVPLPPSLSSRRRAGPATVGACPTKAG
jgi:hypothetical protein